MSRSYAFTWDLEGLKISAFFFFLGWGRMEQEGLYGGYLFFFFFSFFRTRMMLHAAAHPTGQNEKLHHKGPFS